MRTPLYGYDKKHTISCDHIYIVYKGMVNAYKYAVRL